MNCKYTLSTATQCRAKSMKSTSFCFRHNPDMKARATQASHMGGSNRAANVAFSDNLQLTTTEDIDHLLAKVIQGVWKGEIPIKVAGTIGFLSRCWIEAHEKGNIEKRILLLEQKANL